MVLRLDHVAISASDLQVAGSHLERVLGAPFAGGGKHVLMGTHNRLLSLGPDLYLEIIAVDPEAPAPSRPRWFGLDAFRGAVRPTNWIVATDDLGSCPPAAGRPLGLARGDLKWSITVPDSGHAPNDGLYPAFIRWEGKDHPAAMLPDQGCRLIALTVSHPDIGPIRRAVAGLDDARIRLCEGQAGMTLELGTPNGNITL